ncbi:MULTISPECIES: type II secretion system F family protein [Arthrobacter]|uniref:Type II secretion system F family protein n=2 Tax=Arthrobacter TaxID=1663 RepID=A0ABU9KKZ0_9MICC|nr:type II secretion system F family protein [Arthrobacter sp. YJM1]MDP5227574.1 type II secretion system F family protein [Arthrobacter sp. YJM1]
MELAGALLEAGVGVERCLQVLSESASPATAACLGRVSAALAIGAAWDGAWLMAEQHAGSGGARPRSRPASARGAGTGRNAVKERSRLSGLRRHLGFAALSGAPAAGTLYAGAAAERRRRFREAERRAAALGVRLVLPLGLCSLPSFVCLGIIPVVLALLPGGL